MNRISVSVTTPSVDTVVTIAGVVMIAHNYEYNILKIFYLIDPSTTTEQTSLLSTTVDSL